ncbi:vesicle-associated membrane protein 2-like isoform X2 [Dendropsophus ebraccatus]|uniref:vesicle-associated membrane protein 2-like isoform X2 n=1 Tax=Dendropsophus ebraccatus TaxID=150705 RepID=UPI0038312CA7
MSAPAAGPPDAPAEGGGPQQPPNLTSNRRLQQSQAQVDEVVEIMRVNVEKVLERDQKLSEVDERADALREGAEQFETCAAKLKNKYWLQNMKMMIIMGVICAIILIIIIGITEIERSLSRDSIKMKTFDEKNTHKGAATFYFHITEKGQPLQLQLI